MNSWLNNKSSILCLANFVMYASLHKNELTLGSIIQVLFL